MRGGVSPRFLTICCHMTVSSPCGRGGCHSLQLENPSTHALYSATEGIGWWNCSPPETFLELSMGLIFPSRRRGPIFQNRMLLSLSLGKALIIWTSWDYAQFRFLNIQGQRIIFKGHFFFTWMVIFIRTSMQHPFSRLY